MDQLNEIATSSLSIVIVPLRKLNYSTLVFPDLDDTCQIGMLIQKQVLNGSPPQLTPTICTNDIKQNGGMVNGLESMRCQGAGVEDEIALRSLIILPLTRSITFLLSFPISSK